MEEHRPLYSIITPCFQPGDRLRQTMESILAQTFTDYEVIVKDAGSTDGSVEALPNDPRIQLIRSKDQGIYDGMNQAVEKARGDYLYFLNCGDCLHDAEVLEKVAERIRSRNFANKTSGHQAQSHIYYGDVVELQTGQRVAAKPEMTHFAMYRNLPCHQACFYSRDLFETRQFDLQYRVRADYEHFLWSVVRAGAKAEAMDLVIADYEGGGFSETAENRRRSAAEHRKITTEYFGAAECTGYRLAMVLSLQPLRAKMASSPATAALYDRLKNRVYRKG